MIVEYSKTITQMHIRHNAWSILFNGRLHELLICVQSPQEAIEDNFEEVWDAIASFIIIILKMLLMMLMLKRLTLTRPSYHFKDQSDLVKNKLIKELLEFINYY
jgi:hypothetical protein